jgi:apolipoprotein N-acyltransferase
MVGSGDESSGASVKLRSMSAVSTTSPQRLGWIHTITSQALAEAPPLVEWIAALATSLLLILSFPNFDFAPLAWIGLVPLLVVIARRPSPRSAFILGWATGTVFFYGSCYWLTYSMVHYGGLPSIVAYLMLLPGALVIGVFPGIFAMLLAIAIQRFGTFALLVSPIIWVALEYVRLGVTGQLWNAIGYSQAFYPTVIQSARFGGVYAVSLLIVAVNAAVALVVIKRSAKVIFSGTLVLMLTVSALFFAALSSVVEQKSSGSLSYATVIALQPNVPMTLEKSSQELENLLQRHLSMSAKALEPYRNVGGRRLLIWPESPMNFTYASDKKFQEVVRRFAQEYRTSILFNSLEPAPDNGSYNSAVLINEEGRMISQYDKIRLMPFGEYVPIPSWLPGASLITAIVGDFTPGANYTLMPIHDNREAGVFICVESAYPSIARALTSAGADVLINISNDGYLGPTAVMKQHLANAVFRAVENGRPVLRVTNTGITALIERDGTIRDETRAFETDIRVWRLADVSNSNTFYTRSGDLVAMLCTALTAIIFLGCLVVRRRDPRNLR